MVRVIKDIIRMTNRDAQPSRDMAKRRSKGTE